MAVLAPYSGVPYIDPNGDPYSGLLANFWNSGTTTPQPVFSDSGLTTTLSNPVVGNASGVLPAIFMSQGRYHILITSADGSETIFEADGVETPLPSSYVPPTDPSTDTSLLAQTGDIKAKHGIGAETGWVRAAGRTIGSAASGATERANPDTLALYIYLWTQDATLAVSGGRGGSASADFAANKTIALPDYRSRGLTGLAAMGNAAAALIADAMMDGGETADTLGATVGQSTHVLTVAELAAHTHVVTDPGHNHTLTDPGHIHNFTSQSGTGGGPNPAIGNGSVTTPTTASAVTGITVQSKVTGITNQNAGTDAAHTSMQPSVLVTWYLKL